MDLPKDLHIHTLLPALHVIGMMLMLIWTPHLDTVAIVGPSSKPTNASPVSQILRYSNANDGFLPPSLLAELDIMYYGGDLPEKSAGEKISKASSGHTISLRLLQLSSTSLTSPSSAAPSTRSGTTLSATTTTEHISATISQSDATFENRVGDLYELFFDRVPKP